MIDITGVDLTKLVKKVYELSRPQGLGHLHYQPGGLTDSEAAALVIGGPFPVDLDYVRGRACKMTVRAEGARLLIKDRWYDHSDEQLRELLDAVGLDGAALLAKREAA